MQLDFTDDQVALRDSIRDVLGKECSPARVREHVDAVVRGVAPKAGEHLWHTAVELDWPALCVPAAQGGVGLGVVELAIVAEELGRAIVPGPLSPTLCGYAPVLRASGAALSLSALASGSARGAIGLADDGGAFSAASVGCTAKKVRGGWELAGTKRLVVGACEADTVAVAVRAGDSLAVAIVPATSVEITPVRSLDATRTIGHIALRGAVVDDESLLACGADAVGHAAEEVTVAVALELVGTCQSIFDTNLRYAKERVQFGVPIGSFQAVKHKLADMFVAIERARAVGLFAAATIEEDDPRRSSASSMAKAAAGECSRLVARDGIQLLGGIGFTWEHDQQMFVKRAKAAEALHGSAAAHRARVAELLGL